MTGEAARPQKGGIPDRLNGEAQAREMPGNGHEFCGHRTEGARDLAGRRMRANLGGEGARSGGVQ